MKQVERTSLIGDAAMRIHRSVVVKQDELERLSKQKTPRSALAVFRKPETKAISEDIAKWCQSGICLALDGVQDPGNLGTLLRVADWFGIEHILASFDTADVFAPKVVQSTMGAIGRVKVHYVTLEKILQELSPLMPVYGTVLDGENIYLTEVASRGIIVMGNEGNGISREVQSTLTHRLLIPSFPTGRRTSESLNVGVAAAVVCAEFRRRESHRDEHYKQ